ncbi:hypothetical protein J5N97_028122 [Dioscorea zingiberensis]|uniref:Uncharacterized protein n=1 Tax=Dioscorea zingiberensis TaxID=325984 RepID=A0A9D5H4E5_9LILI|nr:hypothetical protein J5N97_028122 [Dioscorea zingiberensis]
MVKLATARESRAYGPRRSRNRWEYINAGLYLFAAFILVIAFVVLHSLPEFKQGLVLLLIGIVFVALVNAHDLFAHIAGVDYCIALVGLDVQLGLVEFTAPLVHLVGSILMFLGILFLLIQSKRGYSSHKLKSSGLSMLITGPVFWLLGSVLDLCQIYERADGHVQILQKGVQIPLLMGSLLFLVGGVFDRHDVFMSKHQVFRVMGRNWIWFGIAGSLLFFLGGLMNVVKVFKIQQMDGMRLEKLRGGAQERLRQRREGQAPLISEDDRRRNPREETRPAPSQVAQEDVVFGTGSKT